MISGILNKTSASLLMVAVCFCAVVAAKEIDSQTEPQKVTLYAKSKYKAEGYGRSAFNFQQGIRSDDQNWLKRTGNHYHLLYGNVSINGDSDWFGVSSSDESQDRIKDLGEIEWADLCCAPVLPAPPRSAGGIRIPGRGESFEVSSDQRVSEAVVGHMYVVHIKTTQVDLYAMFRVEELAPNDHCTITWKVMASPE